MQTIMKEVILMNESIFTPIFIGFAINMAIFFVSLFLFKKNSTKSTHLTLFISIFVLAISFVVGSWLGMGMGVVSLGMFTASIILYILNFTFFKYRLAK